MQPILASRIIIKDKTEDFHFWKNLLEAFKKPFSKEFLRLAILPLIASLLWNALKPDSTASEESFFVIEIIDYFVNALIDFPVYTACLNSFYFGERLQFKLGKKEMAYLYWDVVFYVFAFLVLTPLAMFFFLHFNIINLASPRIILPLIGIFLRPFTALFFVLVALNVKGLGKIKKSIQIGMKLYKELFLFLLLLTAINRCSEFLAEYAYQNSIVWSLWTIIWTIYSFYIKGVRAAFMTSALKTTIKVKETL